MRDELQTWKECNQKLTLEANRLVGRIWAAQSVAVKKRFYGRIERLKRIEKKAWARYTRRRYGRD